MTEKPTCPMSQREVIDTYFLEHRAKVLDIASFLDRIDRCEDDQIDFRITALRQSIEELLTQQPDRTERILHILSDQTNDPIDSAGIKDASGAPTSNTDRSKSK